MLNVDVSSEVLKVQGNQAFASGDAAKAEELYTRALVAAEAEGSSTSLHLLHGNRAAAQLKLGNPTAALKNAEAATNISPSWVKGWYRKALALQRLGRAASAREAARKALRLEPGNQEVAALLQQLRATPGRADPPPAGDTVKLGGAREAGGGDGGDSSVLHLQATGPAVRRAPTAEVIPPQLRHGFAYKPSADGAAENLLILLHGLGDGPGPYAELARKMALPQTCYLAVAGPLELPFSAGGRSWFEAFDAQGDVLPVTQPSDQRLRSLESTVALLLQLLAALEARCGWRARRVHLFGFSQGATLALALAARCRGAAALGGCMSISGALLPEQLASPSTSLAGSGPSPEAAGPERTPVVMTVGSHDEAGVIAAVQRSAAALKQLGHRVEMHTFAKGHEMVQSEREMRALMTFWAGTLSRRPLPGSSGVSGGQRVLEQPGAPLGSRGVSEDWVELTGGAAQTVLQANSRRP